MDNESSLLRHLQEFNRKERFFLVGMALGNPKFLLAAEFRELLAQKLGLRVPGHALVAMDYHLDWLAASLYLAANEGNPGPYPRNRAMVTATQQDVDLLVAFENEEGCHIILVEAKGVTGFSNPQFRPKVERLKTIFGAGEAEAAHARPHFVLVSPTEPRRLEFSDCPAWMLRHDGSPLWLKLPLPPVMKKVLRCDKDGSISQRGEYWKVVPEPLSPQRTGR